MDLIRWKPIYEKEFFRRVKTLANEIEAISKKQNKTFLSKT